MSDDNSTSPSHPDDLSELVPGDEEAIQSVLDWIVQLNEQRRNLDCRLDNCLHADDLTPSGRRQAADRMVGAVEQRLDLLALMESRLTGVVADVVRNRILEVQATERHALRAVHQMASRMLRPHAKLTRLPPETETWVVQTINLADADRQDLVRLFANRLAARQRIAADQQTPTPTDTPPVPPAKKRKRSTARGEARIKIIGALAKHHQYDNGSCLCTDPIGASELAELAEVAKSSVSRFLNEKFGDDNTEGYARYRGVCRNSGKLGHALKLLRGDCPPSILFNALPNENRSDDTDE
jgi:hypothetical protein